MNKNNKGLTLVEVLVASTIMIFVVVSMYALIIATQKTQLTEGRKLDMNQSARVVEQILYDNFRSAGSVLSILNGPNFLGGNVPFNGILPLNNNNYPDGVILAAGDPDAVTRSIAAFNPGDGILDVVTTNRANGTVGWFDNDVGLIVRSDGYYVFRVLPQGVAATRLTIRSIPVYYSGLLNSPPYNDVSDEQLGSAGNSSTYAINSPVIRLDFFNIFLVRTEADGSRMLTMTTDCENVANVLGSPPTDTRCVPLVPNLEDIQFEYVIRGLVVPPDVWASSQAGFANPCQAGNENGASCVDFINAFYLRNIASVRIAILLRTEEEREKSVSSGVTFIKPPMGDVAGQTLSVLRFHYSYMQYEVNLRNYDL